mmetsp:Transcript_22666/g.37493  ORF Transcript_22666/g.37493 Transcript_22666/m.37493 type:complete len:121 (-) Transcript_22666:114-476(-)|eukprot:CAMPEP_0119014306 /NCGR_PEP_ID=MMETSP1176-20130426/9488_1 /TAXON_ID=265551 /ORGANISM="Synedropsis recta cf, Strain CCMP1620" /LENGTH=120 /DNA_ID=CAMNT_0006967461 /DNA_START=105 /DNA_END=467 /DNA_ORIENTATION=-
MTASSSTPRHVVRSILQKLRTNVKLVGGDSSAPTRQFALSKSREAPLQEWSKHYSNLLEGLKERQRLYDIDTGAENKLTPSELSRRAAARCGLDLPELNPDLDHTHGRKADDDGKTNIKW